MQLNKVIILTIFLFFIFLGSCWALENPSFFKGFTAMNEGKYDEAAMYLKISIKANPEYLPAYSHLGLVYERKREFDKAKEIWQEYAKFESYYKEEVKKHIELTDVFIKAEKNFPVEQEQRVSSANTADNDLSQSEPTKDTAISNTELLETTALLEEVVTSDKYPMSVIWLYAAKKLGQLYFNSGNYTQVIPLYDKVRLYYPNDITEEILYQCAYSYQKEKEYDKAIEVYKKIDVSFKIKDKKKIDKYKNLIALCYEGIGDKYFITEDYKKAKETYALALQGFPGAENVGRLNQKKIKAEENLAFYYNAEADNYIKEKQYSQVWNYCQKIVDECKDSAKYSYAYDKITQLRKTEYDYYNKAFTLYANESYDESEKLCQLILKEFPEGKYAPWAQKQIGTIYGARKMYREGIRELLKAAKNYPDSCYADDALERAGVFYWCALGEPDNALKIFKYIITKYPKDSYADRALYYIGVIYLEKKEFRKSYYALNKIIENYPGSDLTLRTKAQINKLKEVAARDAEKGG